MGVRNFNLITGTRLDIKPHHPFEETKKYTTQVFKMPTEVTLAEFNPKSSEAITAHKLSDYRRRRFSLVLLPNISVAIEDLWDIDRDQEPPNL